MKEEKLRTKVFETLGTASMCWSETPKGVFESELAEKIGNKLMADIKTFSKQENNFMVNQCVEYKQKADSAKGMLKKANKENERLSKSARFWEDEYTKQLSKLNKENINLKSEVDKHKDIATNQAARRIEEKLSAAIIVSDLEEDVDRLREFVEEVSEDAFASVFLRGKAEKLLNTKKS